MGPPVKENIDQLQIQLQKEKANVMSSVLGEILASTAQKQHRVQEMHLHVKREEHQLHQRRLKVRGQLSISAPFVSLTLCSFTMPLVCVHISSFI
jgi:hypothetical protein